MHLFSAQGERASRAMRLLATLLLVSVCFAYVPAQPLQARSAAPAPAAAPAAQEPSGPHLGYSSASLLSGHAIGGLTALLLGRVLSVPTSASAVDGTLLSAGDTHTCRRTNDNTVTCWGDARYSITSVPSGQYAQVSAGHLFSCAIKTDATLVCWGLNSSNQFSVPAGSYKQVSAGYDHVCAIRNDDALLCWGGYNNYGERTVPAGVTFKQIAAGKYHTCGIKTDDTLYCWGYNDGRIAAPAGTFTQVSAGFYHSCGVRSDSAVLCWGGNSQGESTVPPGAYSQVGTGEWLSCGLRLDGTVACWGYSGYTQPAPPTDEFVAISVGNVSGCGVTVRGSTYCWGYNVQNQAPLPVSIYPQTLPAASLGAPYSQRFTPTGHTYALVSGNLPPGVSVVNSGSAGLFDSFISGTPLSLGTYNFTVEAQASWTTLAGKQPLALTVNAPSVTLSASGAPAEAGPTSGTFTLTRSSSGGALTVTLNLAGSATFGSDYALSGATVSGATATVVIPDGASSVDLTLTPVDDQEMDAAETAQLAILSGATYVIGVPSTATLTIADNDQAGISVSPTSGLSTSEDGARASFGVRLSSKPTADVSISLASSDLSEGVADQLTLIFTPLSWSTPQTVTVSGVDDAELDGAVAYTISTSPASSNDANYSGLDADDVSVTNLDNDSAGFVIAPTSGLVTSEDGGSAQFTVKLSAAPSAAVTLPLSSSDTSEGAVSPASLTFTPLSWSTPQTVTVSGVDDAELDGSVAYTVLTGAAQSSDASFANVDPVDVSVTNLDNEVGAQDVGLVRIWAEHFSTTGGITTANGNVIIGPVSAGNDGKYYALDADLTWGADQQLHTSGQINFVQGATPLLRGSFTVDTASGALLGLPGVEPLYTMLGDSQLALTPTLTLNVLEPQVLAQGVVALDLPENEALSLTVGFVLGPNGAVSAQGSTQVVLNLAGGVLRADLQVSRDGLVAPSVEYTIDGIASLTLSDLVIDGAGALGMHFGAQVQFPLPDVDLGGHTLVLNNLQGTLGLKYRDGQPLGYTIGLNGSLEINNLPENSQLHISGFSLKIDDGILQGNLPEIAIQVAGRDLKLKRVRFERRIFARPGASFVPTFAWQYEIFSEHSEFRMPDAWAPPGLTAPVVIIKNVALSTSAPYVRLGSAGARFATRQPFYLAGSATADTFVRFDQIEGEFIAPLGVGGAEAEWSVAMSTTMTLKAGSETTRLGRARLEIRDGHVSAQIRDLNVPIAGARLTSPGLFYADSVFTTTLATLTLPADLGGAVATVSDLRIDEHGIHLGGASAEFGLPDISLGDGVITVTAIRAALELAAPQGQPLRYQVALTGTLGLHRVSEGGDVLKAQTVLRIANGDLSGSIDHLPLTIGGNRLNLNGLSFRRNPLDHAIELAVTQATYALPAAWAADGDPAPTLELRDVVLRTQAPYLQIGGAGAHFETNQVYYLAGNAMAATNVRFDQLKGDFVFDSAQQHWKVELSSRITFQLDTENSVVANVRLTLENGHIQAAIPGLVVTVAGMNLTITNMLYADDAFTAEAASMTLPQQWGGGRIGILGLRIDKNGLKLGGVSGTFPIPDQSFGDVLSLTNMAASVSVDDGGHYAFTIQARATIKKIEALGGGSSLAVGAHLTLRDGRISGTIDHFSFKLVGLELELDQPRFLDDRITAETVGLTLPSALGGAGISVYGLEIGGPSGFSIRGGKFKLPDFSMGTIGIQNAQAELRRDTNGDYTIKAGAKLGFQAFAVEGSFTLAYTPSTGAVALRQVYVSFEGTIPTSAIPIGQTGFFITKLWGGFDLTSGSLEVEFGVRGSFAFEVNGIALLSAEGSVKIKARPFELTTNANAKLLGIKVSEVYSRITSSSFTLSAIYELQIARATLDIAFGKDSDGDFTFYGKLGMDVGLKKGSLFCFTFVCVPPFDFTLARVQLDAGKFYHDGRKVWGARAYASIFGFDIYVFVQLIPSVSVDIGRNLNAYEPVLPANRGDPRLAALQSASGRSVYEVNVTDQALKLTVAEAVTTTNRLDPANLQIAGPVGVPFTQTLVYESDDHTIRTYAVELPASDQALGSWLLSTQNGNELMVWGNDPPPSVARFDVCDTSSVCLDTAEKTAAARALSAGTPLHLSWSARNEQPGLALDIYATDAAGVRTLITSQRTLTNTLLSGELDWQPALPSGTYTLTMAVDDGRNVATYAAKQPLLIVDSTAPAPPQGLALADQGDGSALLTWDGAAAEPDVQGYRISVDGRELTRVDGRLEQYAIYGLDVGQTYSVSLAAYDLSGNMSADSSAAITPSGLQLSASWPRRDDHVRMPAAVWATFTRPISAASMQLVDAQGQLISGSSAVITSALSITETATVGLRFTPDSATLPVGTYRATLQASAADSGEQVTISWPFVVEPPQRVYLPLVARNASGR